MVSIPFYLVVLVEIVILESLAIGGFFVFRWWRERQDQVVLEALLTATESTALARNQALRGKLAEAVPEPSDLSEKAELLAQTEILFQRRLLAAFRNERLLSLGHLPVWTEELLVPYQSLICGIQDHLSASVQEHQRKIEREVEHLNADLTHAKDEFKQTRAEIESLDLELTSTKESLAEKTAKIESLEREYVSAFHTQSNTAAQNTRELAQGAATASEPATVAPEAAAPPTSNPETADTEHAAGDDGIMTGHKEEEDRQPGAPDMELTIDESAPADEIGPEEGTGEEVIQATDAGVAPKDDHSQESKPAADAEAPKPIADAAAPSGPSTEPESELLIAEEEEDSDTDIDWGEALAEQAAATEADDPDIDLDWGEALAEQASTNAANDDKQAIKNAG